MKAQKEVDKGKSLVEFGIFLLLLNVVVAVFLWEAVSHHWQIAGEQAVLAQAWITQEQTMEMKGIWEIGYLYLLRFLFGFLGNRQEIVIIVNILLQLSGLLFFYFGWRRWMNGPLSLLAALIFSGVSIYGFSVVSDSPGHFLWFICAIVLWRLSFIRPSAEQVRGKKVEKTHWKEEGRKEEVSVNEPERTLPPKKRISMPIAGRKASVGAETELKPKEAAKNDGIVLITEAKPEKMKKPERIEKSEKLEKTEPASVEKVKRSVARKEPEEVASQKKEKDLGQTGLAAEEALEEEKRPSVKLIPNPLPLPKKKEKKEMGYAFEPPEDRMHYDLNNYCVNDDYDLKES